MVDKSQQLKEFGQQVTALQEANRVIWEKSDEWEPGTNLSAWAYRIAFYEVLTFRKRTARETLRFGDAVVEQLADDAVTAVDAASDRRRALHHCMDELPANDRDLISRRYLEGATATDVARQVNRSAKSVCQSMARIRRRLLDCIERFLAREEHS